MDAVRKVINTSRGGVSQQGVAAPNVAAQNVNLSPGLPADDYFSLQIDTTGLVEATTTIVLFDAFQYYTNYNSFALAAGVTITSEDTDYTALTNNLFRNSVHITAMQAIVDDATNVTQVLRKFQVYEGNISDPPRFIRSFKPRKASRNTQFKTNELNFGSNQTIGGETALLWTVERNLVIDLGFYYSAIVGTGA